MVEALTTRQLRLREWTQDDMDVDFVFDMYSRWEVQRYLGMAPRVMADRDEAVAAIERWRALQDPVLGLWAVELAEDHRLLGTMLLKDIPASRDQLPLPPSGDIEIGWHFHPDAWGQGYATEAARAVLAHGFRGGLDRVVAVTFPENVASQRVCARIGLTHEGRTARYYNSTFELFSATAPG
jgi:RimJ/RimL family protein N-acetyltransferase